MICNKCNFQNEDTAKFCRNCGKELINLPNNDIKPENIYNRYQVTQFPPPKIRLLPLKIIALVVLVVSFAISSYISISSHLSNNYYNLINMVTYDEYWKGYRVGIYIFGNRCGGYGKTPEAAVAEAITNLNDMFAIGLSIAVISSVCILLLLILGFRKK